MKKLFLILLGMASLSWADSSTPLLPIEDPATQRDFQSLSQKIASLTNPLNITSGTIAQLQVSTITGVTSINGSWPNPNILINGGFEFWQRTSSITAPANGVYVADRWKLSNNATTVVVSTETTNKDLGTWGASVQVYGSPSSKNWTMEQFVENYLDYAGKTLSVSVRMKCSVANACSIVLGDNVTNTQSSYHTGGGNWETLTVTKTISASVSALYVHIGFFNNGDMQNGTYYWDSAMLVVGNQPIGFIPMNYQEELAKCQRYYEKSYKLSEPPGTVVSATNNFMRTTATGWTVSETDSADIPFKVPKRTAPSVTLYNKSGASGTWTWWSSATVSSDKSTAVNYTGTGSFGVYQTADLTYRNATEGCWTADAEM